MGATRAADVRWMAVETLPLMQVQLLLVARARQGQRGVLPPSLAFRQRLARVASLSF
jgi:hypothetical protein